MDGFDKMGKKADQQAKQMSSAFKAVGVVLAGVFTIAAIKEQVDLFKGTLDELAKLDDAAAQAGTSVEKFSETWLFLRPTGVSIEQLTGLTDALVKSLGKGGKEGEKVSGAFAEIGVSARDAAGNMRDPIQVLQEMATALAEFDNDGNKVALTYALLGKRAGEFIPILEDLGKKTGESASITAELAEKSELLANQLREIGQQGDMLRINFINLFIDDLGTLIGRLNSLSKFDISFWKKVLGVVGPTKEMNRLNEELVDLERQLGNIEKGALNVGNAEKKKADTDRIKARVAELRKEQSAMSESIAIGQKFDATLKNIEDRGFKPEGKKAAARAPDDEGTGKPKKAKSAKESEAEKISDWLDKQVQTAEKYNLLEETAIKILEAKEKANHGITDAIEAQLLARARESMEAEKLTKLTEDRAKFEDFLAQVLDKEAGRVDQLAQSYRDLGDPVAKYLKQIGEINDLQKAGKLNSEEGTRARDAINDQIAGLDKVQDKVEEMDEFSKSAAQNMQSGFADFLFEPFADGIDGMAKNFEKAVRRMVAEAAAAQLMKYLLGDYGKTGSIGGVIGSLMTGLGGSGSSTNTTGTTLRALEGGSDASYGSAVETKSISPTVTVNVNGGQAANMNPAELGRLTKSAVRQAMVEAGRRNANV